MEKNTSENNDNEDAKNNDAEHKTLSVKEIVTEELERLGSGGAWVWTLFFLCYTPNVLNGFHVSSYVFIGHVPNEIWCGVNELRDANWTNEQIRSITGNNLTTQGCTIWNWNYDELSKMTYEEALDYTNTHALTDEVKCTSRNDTYYDYSERDTSIVPEWDLVCDKAVWRTSAQLLVSIGKFAGATTFGLISDKYGRKRSFMIAGSLFIIGSVLTTISPWFGLFLAGRMALGLASSGMVYPAFALLSENISVKYRSLMSIAFGANYPIGMLILALAAYLTHPWRYLLLVLTIPSLLILLAFVLLKESPRWLLMKNREADAYRIVFKKKPDIEIKNSCESEANNQDELTFGQKFRNSFKELNALFGQSTMRRMALTCYFMWCVTSLCYYVTALNADNLSANRYLYVAITGCVDIVSYIFPMILLKFMGRKTASFGLYTMAGISLLVVLAIPQDSTNLLVFFAMFGRFGISGVYSIVTLYTAELFPTEIRSFALGTSSTMAHVGSMIAPYIVDILGLFGWFIPTTICGCSIIAAGLLVLTLPETGSRSLKDTVKDDVGDKQEG